MEIWFPAWAVPWCGASLGWKGLIGHFLAGRRAIRLIAAAGTWLRVDRGKLVVRVDVRFTLSAAAPQHVVDNGGQTEVAAGCLDLTTRFGAPGGEASGPLPEPLVKCK